LSVNNLRGWWPENRFLKAIPNIRYALRKKAETEKDEEAQAEEKKKKDEA
jgi:hypothetical protein